MPLLRRLTETLLCLSILVSNAAAQSPVPDAGCYARDYGKGIEAQNISWLRIGLTKVDPVPNPDAENHSPVVMQLRVKFGHWSLPAAEFGYDSVDCTMEGPSVRCPIFCDGGALNLRPLMTGDLLTEGFMRIGEARLSSILLGRSHEVNFFIDGTHVLKRVPPDQCKSAEADGKRVLFQVGDYHPMVQQLNAQLAKLGYLPIPAEPLYSKESAAAMRAFQESVGYQVTGIADAQSVRALNVRAFTSGGC